MSLPDERTRSVIQAGELLRELAMHPELPEAVRLQSKRVLRHYPAEADIFRAGAVDEKLREVLGRLEAEGTLPQELRRLLLPEPLFCPRPKIASDS